MKAGSVRQAPVEEPAAGESGAQRLARLVRILGVSGRRLVECAGGWRVAARGDRRRRPLMAVDSGDVEQLRREGRIVPSPGGYVLASGEKAPAPESQPAAGPWIFAAAGVGASNLGGAGFAGFAMKAKRGRGPLTLRQAMAGLRLVEDAEQAGRDPALTMNWDAAPADRQVRAGRDGARWPAARAAERRLERIRSGLDRREFMLVWCACVERTPLRVLEQRLCLSRLAARRTLSAALEKVAEAYDG